MKEHVMALSSWREQAIKRGISTDELPTAHELGLFVRFRNNPEKFAKKPNITNWAESLNRLLQAVDAGAFDKNVPLGDYFFKKTGDAAGKPAQPAKQKQAKQKQAKPQATPQPAEPAQPSAPRAPAPAPQEQQPTATQPATSQPAAPQPRPLNIPADRFAAFDAFADSGEVEGARLRVTPNGDDPETYTLTWKVDSDAPVKIFRVLSLDKLIHANGTTPDKGNLLTISGGDVYVDDREIYGPIRTYHVWMNEGKTEDEALAAQPKLLGATHYVVPITDFMLEETGGRIDGSWTHIEDTDRVDVWLADPRHGDIRVFEGERNLHGFNWTPEQTGRNYTFKARRFVGEYYSEFCEEESVYVEAELEKIPLDIQRTGDSFTVSWKHPSAGAVRVYATPEPLKPGIAEQRIATSALIGQGMGNNVWSNRNESGGTTHTVLWPADQHSLTISAVHVVGDWAQVGHTKTWVKCGTPTNVDLFQRIEEQIITFTWPVNAYAVELYVADQEIVSQFEAQEGGNFTLPSGMTSLASITEKDYKYHGGLRVEIPPDPVPLVLMPYRLHEGQRVYGRPAILDYEGLHKVSYEFDFEDRTRRRGLQLKITSHNEYPRNLHFVLRAERNNLPIDHRNPDAYEVQTMKVSPNLPPGHNQWLKYIDSSNPFISCHSKQTAGEYFQVDTSQFDGDPNIYLRLFLQESNTTGEDENWTFDDIDSVFEPQAPAVLLDPPPYQLRPFYDPQRHGQPGQQPHPAAPGQPLGQPHGQQMPGQPQGQQMPGQPQGQPQGKQQGKLRGLFRRK
ncbi:hypothetical protein [Corynebacterium aquatimens]|uniref:Uncharacterized protein n=1 Tax=Corynebacterium aquatimens TaxID=1190508 RepID=A0A931GXZ6_9CORY|nr:hypothetical protein [Corynebacterium aquatimens]MBG6122894.1 hypothetical protein [Corynebacterium aquatimens]WJY66771.1 hypothetical protein CAQUA_10420 [Corynebacterium aquatimens]